MRYRHQGPRSPKVNGLEMQTLAEPGVGEYICAGMLGRATEQGQGSGGWDGVEAGG